jgi:hypothetical protein
MNVVYNSDNYCVREYPAEHGYEVVDKRAARGTFLQGDAADRFLDSMESAAAEEASVEHLDEFVESTDALFIVPVVFHLSHRECRQSFSLSRRSWCSPRPLRA